MKSINTKEKALINTMISMVSKGSVSLQELLEKMFFHENEGRALIIQTVDHYSVFYLKNNLFDDAELKKEQLVDFLELMSLLNYLATNNYLYFLPKDHNKGDKMYFIQDAFNNPEAGDGPIILNTKGDYTLHPTSISDKNDDIIYKGIFLDNDTSIFLETHAKEVLFLTEQLKGLLVDVAPKKESRTKFHQKWWRWSIILNIITMLKVGAAIFFFWNELQNYNPDLSAIEAYNTEISTKIDSIKAKLDNVINENTEKKTVEKESEKTVFYGMDISHYNKAVVDEIKSFDSISFVICKATEGLHFRDSYFDYNWKTLKEKSIIRGAYHFYHINSNPIQQAKHYISVVKEWEDTDITPIVDIEGQSLPSNKKSINKEKLQKNLLKFLDYIENKTKRKPMIYVSTSFADRYLQKKEFSEYPLWIADYDSEKAPHLPKIWKKAGFKIWQKSNNYHFKSTRDDLDVFYGKLTDIYK